MPKHYTAKKHNKRSSRKTRSRSQRGGGSSPKLHVNGSNSIFPQNTLVGDKQVKIYIDAVQANKDINFGDDTPIPLTKITLLLLNAVYLLSKNQLFTILTQLSTSDNFISVRPQINYLLNILNKTDYDLLLARFVRDILLPIINTVDKEKIKTVHHMIMEFVVSNVPKLKN